MFYILQMGSNRNKIMRKQNHNTTVCNYDTWHSGCVCKHAYVKKPSLHTIRIIWINTDQTASHLNHIYYTNYLLHYAPPIQRGQYGMYVFTTFYETHAQWSHFIWWNKDPFNKLLPDFSQCICLRSAHLKCHIVLKQIHTNSRYSC